MVPVLEYAKMVLKHTWLFDGGRDVLDKSTSGSVRRQINTTLDTLCKEQLSDPLTLGSRQYEERLRTYADNIIKIIQRSAES